MSTFQTVQCTRLGCGDWKLRDIRFIDDQEILIGLSSQSELERHCRKNKGRC